VTAAYELEPLDPRHEPEPLERPGVDEVRVEEIAGERVELTPYDWPRPWMRVFIAVLARSGDVSMACRVAEINRRHVYDVRSRNPDFADAWAEAIKVSVDLMEQIMMRRIAGEEQVITRRTVKTNEQGAVVEETVATETRVEDDNRLLEFALKGRRPEVYRERHDHVVHGADGGPVQVEVYRYPSEDRVLELARLMLNEPPAIEGTVVHRNGDSDEEQ